MFYYCNNNNNNNNKGYLRSQINKEDLPPVKKDNSKNPKFDGNETIDTLQEKIKQNEQKLIEINNNQHDLNKSYVQFIQMKNVLEKVDEYLASSDYENTKGNDDNGSVEIVEGSLLDHNIHDNKNFR